MQSKAIEDRIQVYQNTPTSIDVMVTQHSALCGHKGILIVIIAPGGIIHVDNIACLLQ